MSDVEKKAKKAKKTTSSDKHKKTKKTDITKPKPKKSRIALLRAASRPVFEKQIDCFDTIIAMLGKLVESVDEEVDKSSAIKDPEDKHFFVNYVMENKAKIWNLRDVFKYNKMFIEQQQNQLAMFK